MTPKMQERQFPPSYASELMRIARSDLAAARSLASAGPDVRQETMAFLAQQSLEKGLKAVLCHEGVAVPLVHDIGALIAKLPSALEPPFGYELATLSEFAAIRRYMDTPVPLSTEEGAEILKRVEEALAWCEQQVTLPPPS